MGALARHPVLSAALAALVAACSAGLPGPPLGPRPPSVVAQALAESPPPAEVEWVPARPRPDAVWVDGQWSWSGRRYAWQPGGWYAPPAPGVRFAPWAFVRGPDGAPSFYEPAWFDATGKVVAAPALLAPAASGPTK